MEKNNGKKNKLSSEETSILKKMSVHNFSSQLITNDMRKVVNKEIWK
jgi:ethanolamine utilization protein EutQ (cupin superfamily)